VYKRQVHGAVAKGAPAASCTCMRLLVGRLHAALQGWEVTLGAAAAMGRRQSGHSTQRAGVEASAAVEMHRGGLW